MTRRQKWQFAIAMYIFHSLCSLLETRPQSSGAILLKCNGTVINLDPVLFTWLAYYPRMSPVVDTSTRGKQSRKAVSRSVSAVTPRKKSYARGMETDYTTFVLNY
jgi:hypothetical protein